MQFNILKNATLPLLKLQVVKDGRSDFNKFMEMIEQSSIFFSMVNTETGIPKISSRPAGFVEKIFLDPNAEPEYYIYYQFTNRDTNTVGQFEGQFMLRNNDGVLIIPIREKLFIDVQDSFIADDLEYTSCYVSEFPCCVNGPYTPQPEPLCPCPIELILNAYYTPGSVNVNYTLTANRVVYQDVAMSFTNILNVFSGDPITITTGLTLTAASQTTSIDILLPEDFNNIDFNNLEFGDISVTPTAATYTIYVDYLQEIPNPTELLGRIYIEDNRDSNYLISDLPKTAALKPTSIYWDDNEWWGNQGNTPQCVGYAWAHWIEDGPITHNGIVPIVNPTTIYKEAQKIDEWIGESYNGTSVRAGAKYLKNTNKISAYYWAFDLNTLIDSVLTRGPVVVGTNWYNGMFYPDKNGLIRISGRIAGGHAYVINGVDTKTKLFRIKNSWGKNWGKGGHAFISFNDMTRLIKEQGEICLALENIF